jgi:hypothetical protein
MESSHGKSRISRLDVSSPLLGRQMVASLQYHAVPFRVTSFCFRAATKDNRCCSLQENGKASVQLEDREIQG